MECTIDTSGPFAVASLAGEFGMVDDGGIGPQLSELVATPNSRLAISLSETKQINSVGLSALITVVSRARLNGSRVVLVAPAPYVVRVLELTQLNRWFEIVDNLDAAAEMLGAST